MTPLKPMLAKDVDWKRLRFPVVVQPKLDGIRVHVQGGVALTRTLKRVPNAEIQAALGSPAFEGFDGEVIVGDPTSPSCYRDTSSFVMSESKRGADWTFYAFDLIDRPIDWYPQRRDELAYRLAPMKRVQLVAQSVADNAEELERMEAILVGQGHEGVILRDPQALYKHGRSTPGGPLLKVKRFTDFEAEVVGVYEENHNANERFENELGRGARSSAKAGLVGKNTLGGLVVKALNGPWEGVEFRVGTGFDAAQRQSYWDEWHVNAEKLPALRSFVQPGVVAKIKAFDVGAKDKPRHPVFLGWRDLGLDG